MKLRRRPSEAELDAELRAYLDQLIDENLQAGMAPEEARRAASAQMEGMTQVKELCRETRRFAWFTGLAQDARCAARNLARHPGFTAAAALSLALGIGANAAIFLVFYRALIEPLPYRSPDQLYALGRTTRGNRFVSNPELATWQRSHTALATVGGWSDGSRNLTAAGDAERLVVAQVTPNWLSVLGVSPALGRDFAAFDGKEGAQPTVLLTDELWRRKFNADPGIVGRNILLNDQPTRVAGVLGSQFVFPGFDPEALVCDQQTDRANWAATGVEMLNVVGRLRPGATAQQAIQSLNMSSAAYRTQMNSFLSQLTEFPLEMMPLREKLVGETRPALNALLGAVGLLMLIACVNVANLQLARAALRRREIGLRVALGAGRGRIARWLVVENFAISGLAGIVGAVGAYGILALLRSARGVPLAGMQDLQPGWMLWCAAFALSAAAGLVAGLAPSLSGPRIALHEALKSNTASIAGPAGARVRSALVLVQVALALTLLIGSALLLRSLQRVLASPLGYQAANVLTAQMRLSAARYKTPETQRQFVDNLLEQTRALPGVEWAGVTTGLPTGGYGEGAAVSFEGQPESAVNLRPGVPVMAVTPDYFRAMGITLLRGRSFSSGDDAAGAKAAVVTEAFARRFYPSGDALGQRIRFGTGQWIEIAGVTDDVHHQGREVQADPQVFLPYAQHTGANIVLAVRARTGAESLARAVRGVVAGIDANQPVFGVKTMEERVFETGARRRVETLLLAGFALLALTLAAVGIYGVVSEAVGQRTREIGVRMALGARSADVVRMVLGRSMAMALGGVAAGVGASFYLTKFLATMLFEVKATDATSFAAAAGALVLVALAAAYLPARRAAHIDPAVVLRGE